MFDINGNLKQNIQRFALIMLVLLIGNGLFAQKRAVQNKQKVDKSQAQTVGPVQVLTSVKNDLSLPLSELAKIYVPPVRTSEPKVFPLRPYPFESLIKEMPFVIDPSLQDWQGSRGSRTVLLSFDGVEVGDNTGGGGAPSDQNGDVGPNHYVQMANAVYEIFDKAGNSVSGPFDINVLWAGFGGPCQNSNNGDPVVIYDQLADRWFLSQFAVDDPNNQSICVACSQTSDPTGAYYRYQFNFTTDFPDYPKFGMWGDAYTATYRVFPNAGGFDERAGALERNAMLAGNPAQMVNFSISNLITDANSDGFLPADLDGPAPPAGTPIPILGHQDDGLNGAPNDRLALFELTPDWNNTANSTFTGPVFLATDPYDGVFTANIPQPGTAQGLDILPHFTMYSLQTRDFGTHMSMVTNHTVDVGTNHAGVRWYELRNSGGGWSIFQQGTYAPDNDNRWMGSIAMDGMGNIALGYSVSSSTTFPSIRFTGHTAGAPAGVMDVAEESIIGGTGSQTSPDRWGDYSMMTVDPSDDATFWYTNQYYATTSSFNWKTRIGSFNLGPTVMPSGILIWEGALGGQDYSGAFINTYLTNAGLTTTYTDVFPTSLIGYDAVFLSFGNYGTGAGTNTVFDATMAAAVQTYLQAGGKVYLEGGDALGFDQGANTTLLNLFGLSGAADGVTGPTPITALAGQPGTLTAGMQFNSSTQVNNNYIDVYTAGGGMIAFNEPTVGDVAAQYSGAAGQKTFCFSYALAGLTDGTSPSTKDDLMAAIVNFFGLTPSQPILSVTPSNRNVSSASGNTTFDVANTGSGTMNWTASVISGNSWCTITSGGSGTNNGTINISYAANPNATGRVATIRVTATGATGSPADVTVTQAGTGGVDVIYTVDDATGPLGGQVTVAVNLDPQGNDVCAFDFELAYNPDVLTFVSKTDGSIVPPGAWFITATPGTGIVTGNGFSTTSAPLTGSGNLMLLTFNIAPTAPQTIALSFNSGMAGNCAGVDLLADISDTGVITVLTTIMLSGTINYFDQAGGPATAAVSNIPVNILDMNGATVTSTTTDANGDWSAEVDVGQDYTVQPKLMDDPTRLDAALNSTDAFRAFNGNNGTLPFTNPYQYKVSDGNNSGTLNSTDAFVIFNVAGPSPPNNFQGFGLDDWSFVDADFPLSPTNWQTAPGTIDVPGPMTDVPGLDFVAGLTGDANGSGAGLLLASGSGKLAGNDVAFIIPELTGHIDQTIEIPVHIQTSGETIGAFDFELQYDPLILTYTGFSAGDVISDPSLWNFSVNSQEQGMLQVSGFALDLQTLISEDGDFINLTFQDISRNNLSEGTELNFTENVSAGNGNGNDLKVNTNNGRITATSDNIPTEYTLLQNYPNPFNPETHIQFGLPKDSRVKLEVFDVSGQLVATLVDGPMPAGQHVVDFNARQLSSGLYFYRVHANQYTAVRKMLLMK